MDLKRSPLAPKKFPTMPTINGFDMWTAETGVKYKNRPDVLLVKFCEGAKIAGVFTKSTAPGAPVVWSQSVLAKHGTDKSGNGGLLVNAGNANVFTGKAGAKGVADMAAMAAKVIGCAAENIYVCSTGVIGEPLNTAPIGDALKGLTKTKSCTWEAAARAISTTDTYTKGASNSATIDGVKVDICGFVKGSGMVMPDMATMLGFMFTNANITRSVLQALLSEICETSFNAITVDSDTSTSDTVLLVTSAKADHKQITDINDPRLADFKQALENTMMDLAHQVVKDGEGASKFIKISVTGAEHEKAAKKIAMSIANSPLVKTAIAGEDANWGRIVMAVGKSGEKADRDKLNISFGPHLLAENGLRAPNYDEDTISEYMRTSELEISVNVGITDGDGDSRFTVWTCDLTHGYIDINADYRS